MKWNFGGCDPTYKIKKTRISDLIGNQSCGWRDMNNTTELHGQWFRKKMKQKHKILSCMHLDELKDRAFYFNSRKQMS